MADKIFFIHNPVAGKKRKSDFKADLQACEPLFRQAKSTYEYVKTERSGHAHQLALQAVKNGFDIVVAVGGDGTVNEVASALLDSNVKLGIIPLGSGNGLARDLGISSKIESAVDTIIKAKHKKIDAGKINKKKFFCTSGVGFDAIVSRKFSLSKKRGLWSYVWIVFKHFFSYFPKKYTLTIDKKTISMRAFLVTFSNASQYGNNAYIAPLSVINDGKLDICIIRPFNWYHAFSLVYKMFNKKIHESRFYAHYRGEKIVVKRPKKMVFHYDGETSSELSKVIEVSISKEALKVIIP